ncbi:MAG: ABC transporter substrate-binding protein [Planctomycetes bacterium]|nr:ABC transporter substrate-binding protein [Planctomycetota bacterium]
MRAWLVALIVAAVLFADRLALPRPRPDVLRLAHTFTARSERAILDDAIAEFERRHPGVKVEQLVSNSEVYSTVGWRLQFQRRLQPDVAFAWDGHKVDTAVARGWALDLRPHLDPAFTRAFAPAALEDRSGGVYLLPHSVDVCNLVWFNRDVFDGLGLGPPRTHEEWLRTCEALAAAGHLPLVQGNRDLWPMGNLAAELLAQALEPDDVTRLYRPAVAVEPADLAGLGPLLRLRDQGAFHRAGVVEAGGLGGLSDTDAKVLFLGGKAAQHVVGSWFLADVDDAAAKGELDFEVDLFPVPTGGRDVTAAVKTGFLVNPASANVPAAVALAQHLLSRDVQARFAALGALSLRRDAPEFTHDPRARRLLARLATTGALVPPPDTGHAPDQAALAYRVVGRLLTQGHDLDAAAEAWTRGKRELARKGR